MQGRGLYILCWQGSFFSPIDLLIMLRQFCRGVTTWWVTHVAVVYDGVVYEAIRTGLRSVPLDQYNQERCVLYPVAHKDYKVLSPLLWLRSTVKSGAKYDFVGAFFCGVSILYAHRLNFMQKSGRYFCTELVSKFLEKLGHHLEGHHAAYLPGEFSDLFERKR